MIYRYSITYLLLKFQKIKNQLSLMTVKCSISLPKLRPDVSARETRIALVRSNPGPRWTSSPPPTGLGRCSRSAPLTHMPHDKEQETRPRWPREFLLMVSVNSRTILEHACSFSFAFSFKIFPSVTLCSSVQKFLRSSFFFPWHRGRECFIDMALEKQMSPYTVQRDGFPFCTAWSAKIGDIRTQDK